MTRPTPQQIEESEKTIPWVAPEQPVASFDGVSSTDYDYTDSMDVQPEDIEPDSPIPVYIVDAGDVQDIVEFGTEQYALTDQPVRIAGGKRRRKRLLMRNSGAEVAYVGTNSAVSSWTGYPILANAELEMTANSEVWAICAPTKSTALGVLQEYVIDEDG